MGNVWLLPAIGLLPLLVWGVWRLFYGQTRFAGGLLAAGVLWRVEKSGFYALWLEYPGLRLRPLQGGRIEVADANGRLCRNWHWFGSVRRSGLHTRRVLVRAYWLSAGEYRLLLRLPPNGDAPQDVRLRVTETVPLPLLLGVLLLWLQAFSAAFLVLLPA